MTVLGWFGALIWAYSAKPKGSSEPIDYDRLAAAMRSVNAPPTPKPPAE